MKIVEEKLNLICDNCGERNGLHSLINLTCPSKKQRLTGVTEWDESSKFKLKPEDRETELQILKDLIKKHEYSCIKAYEKIDLELMIKQGDIITAHLIDQTLKNVSIINYSAGITDNVDFLEEK
jgi:hypothetical protein